MSELAKTVYRIDSKLGVRRALVKLLASNRSACPTFACASEYLSSSKPDLWTCAVENTWEGIR